jgi:hypothetical protein
MDHIPVIPCPPDEPDQAIEKALNRLVDETLKRALGFAQRVYLERDGFDWLPAHAPEPITLAAWLREHRAVSSTDPHVFIMHPDPPLGPREQGVVSEICALAGFAENVDILTPRTFDTRGGRRSSRGDPTLVARDALLGTTVGPYRTVPILLALGWPAGTATWPSQNWRARY